MVHWGEGKQGASGGILKGRLYRLVFQETTVFFEMDLFSKCIVQFSAEIAERSIMHVN